MTAIAEQTGFTQEAFNAFLASRDEPSWLTDRRQRAWKRFQELDMPDRKHEEWMRTDIRLFKMNNYGLPSTEASNPVVPTGLLGKECRTQWFYAIA